MAQHAALFYLHLAFLSGADARRVVVGIALHSLMDGKLRYSIVSPWRRLALCLVRCLCGYWVIVLSRLFCS